MRNKVEFFAVAFFVILLIVLTIVSIPPAHAEFIMIQDQQPHIVDGRLVDDPATTPAAVAIKDDVPAATISTIPSPSPAPAELSGNVVKRAAPISYDTSSDLLQNADKRVTITPARERAASFDWATNNQSADTMIGDDGSVEYGYGSAMPVIACAPLHLSVIRLQKGEAVTNLSIGDSVRWKVQAASAGQYPIVVVKPVKTGIQTNLAIMTDAGRVYYVTLASYDNKWVPLVRFYDPEQIVETVVADQAVKAKKDADEQARKDNATVATLPITDVSALDFNYRTESKYSATSIKPVRVFSGGGHTYVQMPDSITTKDAPAIFSVVNGSQQLVNFVQKGVYYVIDGVPDRIVLVLGAGSDAQKVDVLHGK